MRQIPSTGSAVAAELGAGTKLCVVIVSEVRLYRDGLAAVLSAYDGIEIVARTSHWRAAVPLVARLRPDVVLADLPVVEARDAVRQLVDAGSLTVNVVVMSIGSQDGDVVPWAEAGVAGFVAREDSIDDLVGVITSVSRDEMPCSPRVAATLLRRVAALAADRPALPSRLTSREQEILSLIEHGLSNKEIGRTLSIQLATVKNHVHNILEKLQVNRRADAVALFGRRASPADSQA